MLTANVSKIKKSVLSNISMGLFLSEWDNFNDQKKKKKNTKTPFFKKGCVLMHKYM